MSALSVRRSIIVLVAIASLFGGAVVIRAAAGWAADASLSKAPPDPAQLVGQLEAEQAYAASLAEQLGQVTAKANELRTALEAAQSKASSDAASADDLAAQLQAAKERLATLEAQLAAAARARTTTTVTTVTATAPPSGGDDDDGHEGGEEHDD
jgi:septal ring factor EnvC (AmiA/AmiB activator)